MFDATKAHSVLRCAQIVMSQQQSTNIQFDKYGDKLYLFFHSLYVIILLLYVLFVVSLHFLVYDTLKKTNTYIVF